MDAVDKILEAVAGTAPGAVACIIMVRIFLQHMRERDELIKQLHSESEISRMESRNVISENTKALGAQSEILREVAASVSQCRIIQEHRK